MEKQHIILSLTKIHCEHSSGESGKDEIYFKTYEKHEDGQLEYINRYFYESPIEMKGNDKHDDAYVDINIDVTFMNAVVVYLWEKDPHNSDEQLGHWTFTRDDPLEGRKYLEQPLKKCDYNLDYRVISKPVPTLRVLGVRCEEDSKGCNVELVETVLDVASNAADVASEVFDKSPRPRSELISDGFAIASEVLAQLAGVIIWVLDKLEGPDEVYMQHVDEETHDIQGGAFWPSNASNIQMVKGDEVYFTSNQSGSESREYYRFMLDRGPVTIQLREEDPIKPDVSIGTFTFDEGYYNQYCDQGARILIADEYFRDQQGGQGAIYAICVSVGMEDWAKAPSCEAQE